MTKRIYNTTDQSSNVSNINTLVTVNSINEYVNGLIDYTHATNQMIDKCEMARRIETAQWRKTVRIQQKDLLRNKRSDERLTTRQLIELDSYVRSFFIDPIAHGAAPLVDMLYLTVRVAPQVVSKLKQLVKTMPEGDLKLDKTGPAKVLNNYHDKYQKFAIFQNAQGSKIYLYWGLHEKVKEQRPNQRLVKVTLNPARHSPAEITEFFSWFKGIIGKNADQLMREANVTRLDIALDIPGVYVPYLLVDRPNSPLRNYNLNESAIQPVVGTQKFGASNSSCFHAYNKVQKLIDVGPCFIPLLAYNADPLKLIPITRIERVFRFADSKKPKALSNIQKASYFLDGTNFYSPILLTLLTKKRQQIIWECGFSYWLTELASSEQLSSDLLKNCKLAVNTNQLEQSQTNALVKLKHLILRA